MSHRVFRIPFRNQALTRGVGLAALALMAFAPIARAQCPPGQDNVCNSPGEAPDVIVGDLVGVSSWGTSGGISAYSVGTTSCNIGSCWLNWISGTNQHPAISQNMYRLKDGRFEQLGQSWLKHGFTALSGNVCSSQCCSTDGTHLGVNCSDPYSSSLNGSQGRLGPKFEVNPYTGVFNYPFAAGSCSSGALCKRLQVRNSDLDPSLNTGAAYVVEGQYITADDAAAKNQMNNASYRTISVSGATAPYTVALTGATLRQKNASDYWKTVDPTISQVILNPPDDGRLILSAKVTLVGGTIYHYEYALQNFNSHRGIQSFSVPIPASASITNIGFHDVDYHSGEPFDGTDWPATVSSSSVTWSTQTFAVNQNANAVRWGTMYNFRFDANVPPTTDTITMNLFKPGVGTAVTASILTPTVCNSNGVCGPGENCSNCAADCASQGGGSGCCGNGTCEAGENPCRCTADCGVQHATEFPCSGGVDEDCDGLTDCADSECCVDGACAGADPDHDGYAVCDCDNGNGQVWATPGETLNVHILKTDPSGTSTIAWDTPAAPGGTVTNYDLLRSTIPGNFGSSASCVFMSDATLHQATDSTNPGVGNQLMYLVRARNSCPQGLGSLGTDSQGHPRTGRSCP